MEELWPETLEPAVDVFAVGGDTELGPRGDEDTSPNPAIEFEPQPQSKMVDITIPTDAVNVDRSGC